MGNWYEFMNNPIILIGKMLLQSVGVFLPVKGDKLKNGRFDDVLFQIIVGYHNSTIQKRSQIPYRHPRSMM